MYDRLDMIKMRVAVNNVADMYKDGTDVQSLIKMFGNQLIDEINMRKYYEIQ